MMDDFDGPAYRKSRETRAAFIERELARAKAALDGEKTPRSADPEFWRNKHPSLVPDDSDDAIARRLGYSVGDSDGRDD